MLLWDVKKRLEKKPHSPSSSLYLNSASGISLSKSIDAPKPHIPFYSLSAGKPEELSSLILSLESTCQDLFATGYFESDISDDLLTSADGEMLLQ